jgi:choline dehydrogenase-like flavoprotein
VNERTASVVIVGSGIGGATTAYALAERGIDVLILERGKFLPQEPENWSPHAIFIERRYKPDEKWIDEEGEEFSPGVHYYVGGNSKVYGAALPRFREHDFRQTEHKEGTSPSWPFSYNELEPYYCAAERLYKVHSTSGVDPTEPPRSQNFPYPAMEHEPYVRDLEQRLRKVGLHPFPNAMGIDVEGSCVRCSTCDGFVCKVNAKSDAQTCALNPALKTGKVKLLTESTVKRIVLTSDRRRVDHLVVAGPTGEFLVGGEHFVLSAGAVNSAVLLLRSGVANSSDQVGRNFMMHINSHIAAFDWGRRNGLTFQKTLSFNDWYVDGGGGYPLGAVQLIGKVTGEMMKSYATRVPLSILKYIAEHAVEFVLMTEDLPHPENRVRVTSDQRIQIIRNPIGYSSHLELLAKTKKYLKRSGYKAIFRQPFDISMNSHQCGTIRAGDDPRTSVVDGLCKTHDHENLWIIDGGFFPSSAAMNPALTIAAQALRVVAESGLAKI